MTVKETSNIHLDVVKYEKDLLVESIRHVIAGMEDLNGKIENVRSQIDQQVAAVEEEEKKIAIASEGCNSRMHMTG